MIYLWSDTHFNHRGILEHCAPTRPYADVQSMNDALIQRWNEAIKPTDEVYHLGDFAFGSQSKGQDITMIFAALNGIKHLVVGNHDEQNPKVLKLPWKSQHDLVTLRENGVKAIACHYPMETWRNAHRGYLMLHGHCHGSLRRVLPHRFDVGCDVWQAPVSLSTLALIASKQTYEPQDHHREDM